MKLDIVTYPDEVLSTDCERVEEITPELRQLIDDMVETMYEGDGVGLAAPQVGKDIRLITVDRTGPKKRKELHVIINPEIVAREGEVDSPEACLSCPGFQVTLKRSEKVRVTGMDQDGNDVCIDADDLLAIILQHEIDHLDGKTIVDRAGRLKRSMYQKKVKKWKK
ncbi:peptide deformylase [Paucidesulfovibrio gracilis DSM 16080]|uniref:Peptide deformylase n=1 Tax=Paucidesulfovibrio gracilis DSM 16080 TaxID=1121449 RepID=A0A1T4Y3J6_9BACT|nr:peptide deformylase [Paucidesulfovibrio gracilis]SKA96316.1 peptide deformylase [Paucidesulfovibrio gracilis DSM 16080]